ncbi:thymidylate synthase [Virgibacillus halodenitrificans]|uniref:thymidylate synthase n=1 Tax=Virgibacillus halodenitrificans TaxID=1482 RepID=UPI000EF49632|nr:thymidylate synthase [Virgibacillus halodenitrificans]
MSLADKIFKEMCLDILENGVTDDAYDVRPVWKDTGKPAHTLYKFGVVNRYDLSREFPILTTRPIGGNDGTGRNAFDELLWIWQKKSNNVRDLKSKIWNPWADEKGSIGKAYGYQLRQIAKYKEGIFDQVDRVLYQLINNPMDRGMITNIYVHQDLSKMGLRPCAYETTWVVTGNKLNMTLKQRSSDIVVANNWNIIQYALLLIMFSQVSGYEPGELLHVIDNAHIYDRHIPLVKKQLNRETYAAPTLKVNPDVKNFYDFTVDDFALENYQHGENFKIPVAE